MARPTSLASAIATETIWDSAKRFRIRVVISVDPLPLMRLQAPPRFCLGPFVPASVNQSGHRSRWPQRGGMLQCDRAPEMAVQVGVDIRADPLRPAAV